MGVTGRKFSVRGCVGREVSNTMSAPQDRGHGCALDSEAKSRRDRLARICEIERLCGQAYRWTGEDDPQPH